MASIQSDDLAAMTLVSMKDSELQARTRALKDCATVLRKTGNDLRVTRARLAEVLQANKMLRTALVAERIRAQRYDARITEIKRQALRVLEVARKRARTDA